MINNWIWQLPEGSMPAPSHRSGITASIQGSLEIEPAVSLFLQLLEFLFMCCHCDLHYLVSNDCQLLFSLKLSAVPHHNEVGRVDSCTCHQLHLLNLLW
jgi:hypothetical protein